MNKLDNRLQAALDYVDISDVLADVGCDHGYLGIYAINKGVKFVQFIDNKKGPLSKAEENLNKFMIDNSNYQLTLSNGFTNINSKVNTISVMGMGGELISEIIDNSKINLEGIKLILQPNNHIMQLRQYLFDHNFELIDENIVKEDQKFYELIVCKKNKNMIKKSYSYNDLYFGPILLQKKSLVFIEKWETILKKYKEIIDNSLKNSDLSNLKNEVELIERCLCEK